MRLLIAAVGKLKQGPERELFAHYLGRAEAAGRKLHLSPLSVAEVAESRAATVSARIKAEGEAHYPVLTDIDNGYALSLNLAVWVGEEMQRILMAGGRKVPDYQGNQAWVMPIPATFVIARNGVITARFIDPDYRKRMAVEDLLAALKNARNRQESRPKS